MATLASMAIEAINCVFCSIPSERIVSATEHAIVVPDGFPVTKGHSLVIPLRHVQSIYELSETEQHGLWQLFVSGPLAPKSCRAWNPV